MKQNERRVLEQMGLEEERFLKTIAAGEGELEKVMTKAQASNTPLPGSAAFLLYDAHGFPLELTKEVAESRGLTVDEEGFRQEMQEQKQRSKVRSALRCAHCAHGHELADSTPPGLKVLRLKARGTALPQLRLFGADIQLARGRAGCKRGCGHDCRCGAGRGRGQRW